MFKVVAVVDKVGTALDRLAKGVAPYHTNIEYVVCDVHPKRPSPEQINKFLTEAKTADVIDSQYYRSIEMLRKNFPEVKAKPTILTHNNPYSIYESDWNDYQINVANNQEIKKNLTRITGTRLEYIPLTVDHTFWKFNLDYKFDRSVIMVANRIEGKKGILPVAEACKKIGAKLILVGAISDGDYFHKIIRTGNVEYHEQISDESLRRLYYRSGIHVCNSVDNFESGTLPLLEAMLCGVPVLTRKVGHVPDLYNEKNMVIQTEDPEAMEFIASKLETMFADQGKLLELRDKAWNTAKDRNHERRAYSYQKLYRSLNENEEPVSIIMPVSGSPEVTRQAIDAVANQSYSNIELIVVDDDVERENKELIEQYKSLVSFPVRYIEVPDARGYNLAEARNRAIIEATGEIIVLDDQRMVMDKDAVKNLVQELKPMKWTYGNKGAKKDFVENFSAVYRTDIIRMGMFNERITKYGGASQEIRSRARKQGYETVYVESARAKPSRKSSNRNRKRDDIIEMKNLCWKLGLE